MIRICRWLLLGILVFAAISFCFAGVKGPARVVKLPEDGSKWYVSVVGDGERYQEILGWFNTHAKLSVLKNATHFCPITPKSPFYKERYAPNCKALPTVRVQDSKGVVIYEAAGKQIPMTAGGLYGAIAESSKGHELLPWRRKHSQPTPGPTPTPVTPQPNPDPAPEPIDDGGTPVIDNVFEMGGGLLLICGLALLAGGILSEWERAKSRWSK